MRWSDRLAVRRRRDEIVTTLDREATGADIDDLVRFARSRAGVEFFVEPETFATDTTAVAVAVDGEWTRRRVGSARNIEKVARRLGVPAFDVQVTGYPQRMRDFNERRRRQAGPPTVH
jgi:hypothetical protein